MSRKRRQDGGKVLFIDSKIFKALPSFFKFNCEQVGIFVLLRRRALSAENYSILINISAQLCHMVA